MHTQIKVYTVLNGWVVQVGCQLLVYTDAAKLELDFSNFLEDPARTETRILAKACNRKVMLPGLGEPMPATATAPGGSIQVPPGYMGGLSGYADAVADGRNYPAAPPPTVAGNTHELEHILSQRP